MLKHCLFATTPESTQTKELTMTALRLFVGGAFLFFHGWGKIPVHQMMIDGVAALGFPMPHMFAWAAALSELVGGLFLLLGLFTRLGAAMIAVTMVVAAFGAHAADPFQVKELAITFLMITLMFTARGAGKYSLDHVLNQKLG